MKKVGLVLTLGLLIFSLYLSPAVAKLNSTNITQNRTELGTLKSLHLIYKVKKNESLSEEAISSLNEDLKAKGATEFLKSVGGQNLTLEITEKGKSYFLVSIKIRDNKIEEVYFGKYSKAGQNKNNIYVKVNLKLIQELTEQWEKGTGQGKKEPGLGLLLSIGYKVFMGIIQGKLAVRPFWAIIQIGKFLRMSSALKGPTTAATLLS